MQPPPAPRIRSKLDTLIFTSNSVKSTKVEEPLTSTLTPSPQSNAEEKDEDASGNVNEKEIEVECVDRPVDLYKVHLLFSDVEFSFLGFLRIGDRHLFFSYLYFLYTFTQKAHLCNELPGKCGGLVSPCYYS